MYVYECVGVYMCVCVCTYWQVINTLVVSITIKSVRCIYQ